MKYQAFCRNCGADVSLDAPIRIDDFSMIGDGYPLCFKGEPVGLTHGEKVVVWSLLKAYPDHVSKPTLLDRLDSDGANNLVQVLVCRIRHKLKAAGAPDAIQTVHRQGYRWKPGGGDEVAKKALEVDGPIHEILTQLSDPTGQ